MALARDWAATVPYLFCHQYTWREAGTMTGTSPASSSATPGPIIAVHNNTVACRYEITVGDEVAGYAEYVLSDRIVFPHTVIDTAFEGQGLAGQLVAAALDDARTLNKTVVATCSFVAGYIERHPHYADLLKQR